MTMMSRLMRGVFVLGLAGLAQSAMAQSYPAKPIRFISRNAPGGGTSIVARLVGEKLAEAWGEQVIVDGFQKIRPNQPVRPVPWAPPKPAAPATPPRS